MNYLEYYKFLQNMQLIVKVIIITNYNQTTDK